MLTIPFTFIPASLTWPPSCMHLYMSTVSVATVKSSSIDRCIAKAIYLVNSRARGGNPRRDACTLDALRHAMHHTAPFSSVLVALLRSGIMAHMIKCPRQHVRRMGVWARPFPFPTRSIDAVPLSSFFAGSFERSLRYVCAPLP